MSAWPRGNAPTVRWASCQARAVGSSASGAGAGGTGWARGAVGAAGSVAAAARWVCGPWAWAWAGAGASRGASSARQTQAARWRNLHGACRKRKRKRARMAISRQQKRQMRCSWRAPAVRRRASAQTHLGRQRSGNGGFDGPSWRGAVKLRGCRRTQRTRRRKPGNAQGRCLQHGRMADLARRAGQCMVLLCGTPAVGLLARRRAPGCMQLQGGVVPGAMRGVRRRRGVLVVRSRLPRGQERMRVALLRCSRLQQGRQNPRSHGGAGEAS